MNPFTALIAKLASPRTLLAVALSTGVTGVVAGPLTHEAYQARDAVEQRDGGGGGDTDGGRPPGDRDGGESEASSTTSTPTTAPETPGAIVPGSPDDSPSTTPGSPTDPGILGGPDRPGSTSTPPTASPPTVVPPTSRPPRPPAVLVSVSADLEQPTALAGSQLSGTVYVFVPDSAADVVFEVDGVPIERAGASGDPMAPLDTTGLSPGTHVLVVTVTIDGQTTTDSITFTVAR